MHSFTAFWIATIILSVAAAVFNFVVAASRRPDMMLFAVRITAGVLGLLAAAGIVVGKLADLVPLILTWPEKIILAGVFVFAVLFIPSVIERNRGAEAAPIQERAARPTNATIRLRDNNGGDEWVN